MAEQSELAARAIGWLDLARETAMGGITGAAPFSPHPHRALAISGAVPQAGA